VGGGGGGGGRPINYTPEITSNASSLLRVEASIVGLRGEKKRGRVEISWPFYNC